jgi:yecA family protein
MSYQLLNDILQTYESDATIAEAHGIACALLCTQKRSNPVEWLSTFLKEDAPIIEDEKNHLIHLFEQTQSLLTSEETLFEFDLLLPEEEDLDPQIEAMSLWCQGFLWGIGYTHQDDHWQDETKEILRDMIEFTKLEPSGDENEDENALMEIHEYLRSAVLTIHDEFSASIESPAPHE